METTNLSGPELPPGSGKKPKHLIVMLHGYGANGNDLIGLAPLLSQTFTEAHFLSPDAPSPCEMAPFGRQWFSLTDWSPKTMLSGAQKTAPVLNLFIDAQLKRFGLNEDKLAYIGFSQGTMMALYTALRRPNPCAAIVGFSGSLIGEAGILSKPPVCLIHGEADDVVPFGAMGLAEASLKAEGVTVEAHARPGLGHGIDPDGLGIAIQFLKEKLS